MSGGSVLIVDSDRACVRQLTDLMSGLSLDIYVAFSKSEAIDLSLRETFDLCMVAHGLVDGNGLSLFAETLHKRGQTTGVLLSRHANLRVIVEALDGGFSHVITHPIDGQQIQQIVTEMFPDLKCLPDRREDPCYRSDLMPVNDDVPDLKSIASLSMSAIRFVLSTDDLIRIIRSVDYPFAGKERLEYFDRDTLERVVCLVRRWSQQRLAASGKPYTPSVSGTMEEIVTTNTTGSIRIPA